MDGEKEGGSERPSRDIEPMADIVETHVPVDLGPEEFEQQAHIEMHQRGRRHGHDQHVDLSKEEYTPEEISRMLGTSLEVVMRAVWDGQLKAEKKGRDVVCIQHADVVEWLRSRGPGV
jgi:excisionase family DNA binding protein